MTRPALYLTWAATLAFIPVLSFFGRRAQRLVMEHLTRAEVGMALAVITVLIAAIVSWWLVRRRGWAILIHLTWVGVIAGTIFYTVPASERWMHVPLFGLFGFLSVQLFGLYRGIVIALSVSVLDETWQYFLPDRSGDPVDVLINTASSVMGAMLAFVGGSVGKRNPAGRESITEGK